ncbi:MAG: oligosaccharide flippase family protein [Ferruginibacter sp.]
MENQLNAHTIRFTQRSFLLIIASVSKVAVQLLVLYIYANRLSLDDYGHYQSVWLYANFCSVIGLFGTQAILLSNSGIQLQHWIRSHIRSFLYAAIILNTLPLLYILLAVNSLFLPEKALLCVFIICQNISILAETIAIKQEQEKRVLLVNLLYYILFLAVHLWMINRPVFSLMQLLIGFIALAILKTMCLVKRTDKVTDAVKPETAGIGKQWLYLGLHDVIDVVFKWIDKWLILTFISVQQFAIYYNGSYEIPVYPLLLTAVSNIMLVELSKLKKEKLSRSVDIYNRSGYFLGSFIFPLFCFLLLFHRELFLFVFGEKYATAIPVFLVSIFVLPVRTAYYTAVLQVHHRNDIILKGAILDLVLAVLFMAILYPLFGLPGLAGAFVLSTYIQAGYYLWYTSSILKVPVSSILPFGYFIGIFCVSMIIMAGCHLLVKEQPAIVSLATGAAAAAVLCAAALLFLYRRKAI